MKKIFILSGGIIIAVILYFLISSFLSDSKNNKDSFRTAEVTRRDISSSVLATGIIKPKVGAEVQVGSRVSGVVKNIHFQVGDYVEKGELIAEIEPSELKAKYEQAAAALQNAKANYEYSKSELARQESLMVKDFISQNELDLAEKNHLVNKAQLEQAKANLEYAKIQLGYTNIEAPISGVIASVSTQEGETVAASFAAPTFVTIIDLKRLEVRVYVDETDIGRIRKGQEATFTVDTYMDTEFEGTVTAIYPSGEIQDNVVTYIVTMEIDDFKDKQLRPEMTATVSIYLDSREDVLAVPTSALRREQSGMMVTVLENGQKQSKPVKTGWSNNGYTEIIEGLSEGEKVIINK